MIGCVYAIPWFRGKAPLRELSAMGFIAMDGVLFGGV